MHLFRKSNQIKIYGSNAPPPIQSFDELSISDYLKQNLRARNLQTPTPIQLQSLPILLAGRDIIGCAPTGSGKTLAFLIPMLERLQVS